MQSGTPSRTAHRVALRRAAHQVFDDPVVFHDPLALRILGLHARSSDELRAPARPHSRSMRAFLVARSRFAEDTLAAQVPHGVTQYVLLGAGLDTFAYRNPFPALRVFEVDHPSTQAWKQTLLRENGIAVPAHVSFAGVDFHADRLPDGLRACGFDPAQPTVFAWLGVVPYLTAEGFHATLQDLADHRGAATLVLDYGLPRNALPPVEQLMFDSLAQRVAQAGEPFRLFFHPPELHTRLAESGFSVREDLDAAAMNERFFAGRGDGLRVLGSSAHLLAAHKPAQQATF